MSALLTRGTRLSQTQGPVEVDWSNPIARGLVLVDGLAVAQNRVTKRTDVVVGTKLVPAPSGVMRGFGSTVGSGTTDSIETTLNTATAQKTIFVRMRRDGLGGGNLGRVFDKRVSSAEVESCLTTFSPANYLQYGVVFSGGSRLTYWNLPTAGQNISLVLTADNTITNGATAAAAYFDGVLQTVQSSTSTTGTANTNTDNYVIGNRKNDNARNFDGLLSDFLMWNRILSDAEIASISANPWQLFKPVQRRVWFDGGAAAGGGITLTPPLLTSSNTLYAPTLTPGAVSVAPPLLTNSSTLHAPTVSVGGTVVQPPLLANSNDLFAPTLTPGAISVAPPLLPSSNAFFAPVVSVGGTVLQPPLLENTSTPYAPSVGVGAIALGPPLLTNSSTLYTPTVAATGPQTLEPPLLANASTLFAPTVGGVLPLSDAEMRHMYEMVQSIYAAVVTNAPLDVNLVRVRGQTIGGTGSASDPWGPT